MARAVLRMGSLAVACTLLIAADACRKKDETEIPAVCRSEVVGEWEDEGRALALEQWFRLLLNTWDPEQGVPADEARDCSGKLLPGTLGPMAACAEERSTVGRPRGAPSADDLVLTRLDDGRVLAWLRVFLHDRDEASGPVAIVAWTERGVAVRALGFLQAPANHVSLSLHRLGERELVQVQSDRCSPDDTFCAPELRLVLRRGLELVPLPVKSVDACLPGGAIVLAREATDADGQRLELVRTVSFTDEGGAIVERLSRFQGTQANQHSERRRPLTVDGEAFVVPPGLWDGEETP